MSFKVETPIEFEITHKVIDCTGIDWSNRTLPWTFRRVWRIWGLWAALRFLFNRK